MKDRNGPATIARCKENGNCQFIDVINIFRFTVSLYTADTGAWGMDFVSSSPFFSTTPIF